MFLVVILIGNILSGQVAITTQTSSQSLVDLTEISVYIDSFHTTKTLEALSQKTFQPATDIRIGGDESVYWLQFDLVNEGQDTIHRWLHTNVFDSLQLITVINSLHYYEEAGLLIDYTAQQREGFKSVWHNKYGFFIKIPPLTSAKYFLQIRNVVRAESSLNAILLEMLPERIAQNGVRLTYFILLSGAFFSILVFLFLFSLVQFLQNRDKSYGFYSLYLFFCFMYYWWKFEKSNSFINVLFTHFPDWYYYIEVPLWSMMYLTYMTFVMYFIDTKKKLPFFHKFLKIAIIGLAIYVGIDRIIVAIWGLSLAWDVFLVIRIMMTIVAITMIYLVFRARQRLGYYILWGSLMMLIGGFITLYLSSTMDIHYQGPWDIPLLPIQIGIVLEVFFFFIGLGYKSRLVERERTLIYENLKQQEREGEELKKRKEFLNRWYTNISHEFRTPLTVIEGMAEQIQDNGEAKGLILHNSNRLLNLVNQLLDLSKLESNILKVQYQQGDIISFVQYLSSSFKSFAYQRKIMLSFHSHVPELVMDYDSEKLERILVNLIHNAIKFTPEYGDIKLSANVVEQDELPFLKLVIQDNGCGISAVELPHIFDRFYSIENRKTRESEGAGLGLALTKELVRLLDGDILVSSHIGEGTTFTLLLPITQQAALIPIQQQPIFKQQLPETEEVKPKSMSNNHRLPLLLLVEDNRDVVRYLQTILRVHYKLIVANNGKLGVALALEKIPDVIISDVMMPEMNGFELCKTLKNNRLTSHVPIVLLTAKATLEDRLSGLTVGADAYLAKPFNRQELLIRLEKLIENRQLLQQYYSSFEKEQTDDSKAREHPKEDEFIEELLAVIQKNIANPDFDIPQLCRDMAMSKTQLYRKVKALTGKSVALYIRSIRLQRARQLLSNSKLAISEIAEQVGINDLSYFARVYKQKFGQSPSKDRTNFGE